MLSFLPSVELSSLLSPLLLPPWSPRVLSHLPLMVGLSPLPRPLLSLLLLLSQ
jgi:hypothetical protein